MNVKIILKNVASYKKAELETDKKLNLIYGLNGVGKTILSNYLYSENKKEDFPECQDNFDKDAQILVYNEKFIEDNFYEKDIKGIFTLSSDNKTALENIKNAKEKLQSLNSEKEQITNEINQLKEKFEKTKNDKINEIWKIKTKYTGGDRLLDYCFEGLKKKKNCLVICMKYQNLSLRK